MAVSVSTVTKGRANEVWGARNVLLLRLTLDSSYPTGGEPLDLKQFGAQGKVQSVFISQRAPLTGAYAFVYDHTAEKLLVFVEEAVAAGGPLVEVANTTDLSAVIVDLLVVSE